MSDLILSSAMDSFLAESDPANVLLPLTGGTMSAGADIAFANGSMLREGTTDAGNGGAGGIAQVCSISYELKWEAGRLYVMEQDGFTIRSELFGFTDVPDAFDDETKGYIVGSRRILDDGTIYVCTDATTDNAVWIYEGIRDISGLTSINQDARQLIGSDGTTVLAEWSSGAFDLLSNDIKGISLIVDSSYLNSIDATNRQLYAQDGTTVVAQWSNQYNFEANAIFGIGGSFGIDVANSKLMDGFAHTLDWSARTLHDASGNPIAKWGEDFSSGNYGIAFGPDGFGGFYHLLNVDGLNFLSASRYGGNTIDYNGATAIDVQNRQLIANDGTTVMLDWSNPSVGLDAYSINTAQGYTTQGGAAVFLSGFDAGSNSGVVGSLLTGTDLSQALSVDNRQLFGTDGSTIAVDWSSGIPVTPRATLTPNTVAALTGGEGTIAYVNDADTPVTHGQPVVGGGAEKALVCFNGTDWIIVSHLS